MIYMNQLDELLKIFEDEIKQLITREESPRAFYLLKNNEVGKLKNLFQEVGNETLSIVYDCQIIEVYYNPINITNNFIQAPNITDEILEKIFKYLAHHEYGHSLFCESTINYGKFREKHKDSIFENFEGQTRSDLSFLFWILFIVLKESYADFQARKSNDILPKYYLDLYFKAIEQFLRFKRSNTFYTMSILFEGFYSKVLYSSSWFYNFDQWDYLLKKCGKNDKTESLNLIFSINKLLGALIKRDLTLDGYKHFLEQLTLLLWKINYDKLIFENNLDENIIGELEGLLASR